MPSVWYYVFFLSFRVFCIHHRTWDDYKITQNSLNLNVHDKTKVSTLISVWTNPIASFIFVAGSMTGRYLVPEGSIGEYTEKNFIRILECLPVISSRQSSTEYPTFCNCCTCYRIVLTCTWSNLITDKLERETIIIAMRHKNSIQ